MSPLTAQPRGLDVPEVVPPGRELRRTVNYEKAVATFGRSELEFLTSHYNTGDEIGYRAYKALKPLKGRGKEMFDKALSDGIESVPDAPQELIDLFESVDSVPDWVDWNQLHRGSVAYWRGGKIVVMTLAYAAIGAGFRTYGGSRPLVLSRRLIERDQVGRRLIETLRWAANSSKPGGMERRGDGFRMTMEVRWIHAAVRYHLSRNEHWDWDDWGLVVSNMDSLYTMGSLFAEAVVDALQKAGMKVTQRDKEDITALWRYVGHIMGIPEEVNFVDWADLKRKSAIVKMLEHPADEGCRALMKSLTDYMCEEEIEGYEVIPGPIDRRLDADQKRKLTYGLMRAWAGDEICEQLNIPNNRLRYLLPAAKPFVALYDRVTRLLPHDDEAKARAAIEAFGVAVQLREGETEVADADDVVTRLERNSSRANDILVKT
ncbi:DUF2236 domain-containing protein [Gordonia jinghuaiqii]|uniref:DUF2236 domain-containing protein n=1 Tax=Gordonia jinghuaiqii TaxID=2758710 RepID=A0A7D7QJ17_9ACTN|nr:oxygenase MpaB family protein [Gordonia jinghuaiqii]MCR5978403.1 DUF2236 domain-containing protein [Gordonia jinghuaiqii]QMT02744.1 DUF2236 domain-containing protein [Gordonia jinghuaiqii]